MAHVYYIDGYNVLHASGKLQHLADSDLETARNALINAIIPWCAASGDQTYVVFDGQGRLTEKAETEHIAPNLDIIYTSRHVTADAIIERAVFQAPNRKSIIVVSGDRGIIELCMGMGTLMMSPKNFWSTLQDLDDRIVNKIERSRSEGAIGGMEDRLDTDTLSKLKELRDKLDQ